MRGKGGHRDNPDAVQFRSAYRDSCVDSMFVKSSVSNCDGNLEAFLLQWSSINTSINLSPNNNDVRLVNDIAFSESSHLCNLNILEQNTEFYIAGYLLSKCHKHYKCNVCIGKRIRAEGNNTHLGVFTVYKKYFDGSRLIMPSDAMVEFIAKCEFIVRQHFYNVIHTEKPRLKLVNFVRNEVCGSSVQCEIAACDCSIDFIVNLYFTVRIFHEIKIKNQNLSGKVGAKNRKIQTLVKWVYY